MIDLDESKERRQFQRVLFDAPISLSQETQSYVSRVIDVSLKGVLIRTNEDWQLHTGDPINLVIDLGDGKSMIRMHTHVAHIEEEQMGLVCDEIDMDSITHLRRLVELNLGDSSLLERELHALG